MKQPVFLIVDGSSMLVRAFFASQYPGRLMKSPQGIYINAVFGFLNMFGKLIEQTAPSHVSVAWDVSRDTFRRELYPQYKGTRGELPDELFPQFDLTQELLGGLGVFQHLDERYEADDIIGTLAREAEAFGLCPLIVTGDKDALQLVGDRTTVAIMKKGVQEMAYYTPAALFDEMGLTPAQFIDLKGLMGDTSDNIPGVPGIGLKTATKLLLTYGSMEEIYEHLSEIPGKLGERLAVHRDQAFLSKRLATIVRDVPLPSDPTACSLNLQLAQMATRLGELGLRRPFEQLKNAISS